MVAVLIAGLALSGCGSTSLVVAKPLGYQPPVGKLAGDAGHGTPLKAPDHQELATFAAGDFRDAEARFRSLPGVTATTVGYEGGDEERPTYVDVVGEKTDHAMVVLVQFNPRKIKYDDLLTAFFKMHDPTRLNAQGDLHGKFVRSAVFFHSREQQVAAADRIRALARETNKRIVTYVAPAKPFWVAEEKYQQFHENNSSLPANEPTWR